MQEEQTENFDYDLNKAKKVVECYISDRPETLYRSENGEYFFVIQKQYARKKDIDGEEAFIVSYEDEILPIESKEQIKDWFETISYKITD